MAACTSVSPAMAPAGLSLCLLLQAALVLPSTATSKTSAPLSFQNKPIRKTPFYPLKQEPKPLNVAPAAYDLALLNYDDLSAFEEETAIENEPKRSKHKEDVPTNNYEDTNSNDVDFPNYYDSDKQNTVNYDSYAPDSYYEDDINGNENNLPNDPIRSNVKNNIVPHSQVETNINNALPRYNINQESKNSDLNTKKSNEYEKKDKYVFEQNRLDDLNSNEGYDIDNNNVLKSDDFESLNEGYAQSEDEIGARKKRESESTLNKTKPRAVTGDTVLNIAGAVRDTIGELAPFASPPSRAPPAGFPPSAPSGATRLDAVVIRTAASAAPPPELAPQTHDQLNEMQEEGVVTAEEGARVVLPCDAPGAEHGDVTWTRDNEAASRAPGGAGGALALVAARGAAGAWRCASSAGSGASTTLRIYERSSGAWLRVEGRRGRLAAGGAWLPAREGSRLPLACHADGGVPPPVLVWRVLPASDMLTYNRTTYRDGVATSWASVLATRDLHNATITCEAIQRKPTFTVAGGGDAGAGERGAAEGGDRVASVMLQVTYPPTFSISRRPGFGRALVAGRGAALRCDVSANPLPPVAWTRQDEPLPPASVVGGAGWAEARWAALSRAHAGWYRCVCDWAGTSYSSIGYFLMLGPESDAEASPADPHRCPAGAGSCRRPAAAAAAPNASGSRPDNVVHSGAATARAVSSQSAVPAASVSAGVVGVAGAEEEGPGGWRRVSCVVCGRRVRARWVRGATSERARLDPPPASAAASPAPASSIPACHVTTYTAPAHEEVWCVAVNEAGGSVAVFPAAAAAAAAAGSPRVSPRPSPRPAAPRSASRAPLPVSAALVVLLAISTEYLYIINLI